MLDTSSPLFKMALSGLRKTMQKENINKVIFFFDKQENPQIEVAPDDLTVGEYARLKKQNEHLIKALEKDEKN